MRNTRDMGGFTLVEVLIVVVVMAILAATIVPLYLDNVDDAKGTMAEYNLVRMRTIVEQYRTSHHGQAPIQLEFITQPTDEWGAVGSGPAFNHGPYLEVLPDNPLGTRSNGVVYTLNSPPLMSDVTTAGGWLYNASTGEIWINHPEFLAK